MSHPVFSRRATLQGMAALGCSAAAFPALTQITFAQVPTENRLVVIVLRGGMDGLDVVRPVGDRDFATLRPGGGPKDIDLDGFFAMHGGLAKLMPLWRMGELAFAHAVSTPYRDKRSHFDGQDLLEAGTGAPGLVASVRDGWLNRALQSMPRTTVKTAFAIGRRNMRILSGPAAVSNWYPGTELKLGAAAKALLSDLYVADPLFQSAAAEALALTQAAETSAEAAGGRPEQQIATFAARHLRQETRIASFSLNGWDTHRNQDQFLPPLLERLADTILTLRQGLGPIWERTCILAMTEFGRTVRMNGSAGTDHGTAGVLMLAGGAIRGGRVHGNWPGLSEAALYDRRDLMPTADLRAYAGHMMHGLFGLERTTLETNIFPGLDLAETSDALR